MILRRLLPLALILLILACNQEKNLKQAEPNPKSNFDGNWKKIEFLESKGLQGSMIQELNFILKTALEEKNYPQIFKALAIRSKYIHQIEEDSEDKIIESFHEAISNTDAEGKLLLQSALAELYQQYYQQNQYRIKQRNSLSDSNRRLISQMSTAELEEKSDQLYLQSARFDGQINEVALSDYLAVLSLRNEDSSYIEYFSLADFLANRALRHFEVQFNQAQLSEEVLASKSIFAAKDEFVKRDLADQCIQTDLQSWMNILTARLATSGNEFSRIHFDLYRLNTLRNWAVNDSVNQHYFNSLSLLLQDLEQAGSRDRIRAEIARFKHLSRKDSRAAIEECAACEDSLSLGSSLCRELVYEIRRKHQELNVEAIYPEDQHILFAYAYKNIELAYFKLYQLPANVERRYQEDRNWLSKMLKSEELKSWNQELKSWKDFQLHRTELSLKGLDNGNYLIIASDRADFDPDSSLFSTAEFWVSDIAYLMRRDEQRGNLKLFFKDRLSGKPLKGVKVSLFEYDRNRKANNWTYKYSVRGNEQGVVSFDADESYPGNYRMKIEFEDQFLIEYHAMGFNFHRSNPSERSSFQFFSDRKIYQPGQSVRFKAILSKASEYEEKVVANSENEIRLIDPRGEVLSQLSLTTNEFGSISGTFRLPRQALNGNYRIVSAKGSYSFRVEEYRRPSFEVKFDEVKESYRLGDSISISGKLQSYTGLPLNQARVSYRIIQEDQVLRPSPYSSYWPQAKRILISSGEIQLDDQKFNIKFKSNDAGKYRSQLKYTLELNATSPLGENVAAEKTIALHKLPYKLTANIGESIDLQALNELKIQAVKHSGEQLSFGGQLELWSLASPKRVYIEKYWGNIDHQLMSKSEYREHFPYYNYMDSTSLASFAKKRLLSKQAFKSNQALNAYQNLEVGPYLLRAYSLSDEGDTIKWEKRFKLYDPEAKELPYSMPLWSHLLEDSLIQGQEIKLIVGSAFEAMELRAELEYRGEIADRKKLKLNAEQQVINFKTEGMDGRLVVHLSGIKAGRQFVKSYELKVYPKEKPFEIYLNTKRDFTEPGSLEKWSLGVKHLSGKEELEVLASMYDKSLDQLEKQSWNPRSMLYFRRKINWMRGVGSHVVVSRQFNPIGIPFKREVKPTPPDLNWFGFRLGWSRGLYLADADDGVMVSNAEAMPIARKVSADEATKEKPLKAEQKSEVRKDFAETVFFEARLRLSNSEEASFSFKMPDALTTYKFRALAHDKQLNFSAIQHEVINRKQLMVSSYMPAFFRKGDQATIKVKVQNASDELQEGILSLRFFDARSGRPVDVLEIGADHRFSLLKGEERLITYRFQAPDKISLLKYQLSAKGKKHTDIEEGYLKLLPSSLLIAESFPFEVEAGKSRELSYQSFLDRNSAVLENHLYKVEYSRDPRWLAVYALPAILEEDEECPERIFSNLFTRAMGRFSAGKIDGLEAFSKQLKDQDHIASELEMNQDISLIDFENTPWLKAAESEALQRKGLKDLFDKEKSEAIIQSDLRQLEHLQLASGAWPWFKGMHANRYLTQYILGGLEKLAQLEVIKDQNDLFRLKRMKKQAAKYLDNKIEEDYRRISRNPIDPEQDYLSHSAVYYLYARSFDEAWSMSPAATFFLEEAKAHWQAKNPMIRSLIALSLFQIDAREPISKSIYLSLRDIAIEDSLGVHWKFNDRQPYWYNSKIEAQSYLIEFFQLIKADDPMIDEMKKWLLHQKNQQSWPGSKSSLQACHALLNEEEKLVFENDPNALMVGDELIDESGSNMPALLSKSWQADEIKGDLAQIKVNQSGESFGWGAAHWQYFEENEKVASHSKHGLKITSNYYRFNAEKDQLEEINDKLKVGELVKQRLLIEVDYDLEYVYINDQSPACLQAPEMRSGIRYLDGLLIYQNMKVSEKQWFIERLARGTYVLETDFRVSHSGKFSGGVSRLQCMYAPEFVAYDNAGNLEVE